MGLAYYIVTNAEPGTFDAYVNGKAIARLASVINQYAEDLGISSIEDLMSQSEEEMRGMMEEAGLDQLPDWYTGEKWFPAQVGLSWVAAIKGAVSKDREGIAESETLLSDLAEYEEVLTKIRQKSLRWHLAIDY